jgi:hypothetical protein
MKRCSGEFQRLLESFAYNRMVEKNYDGNPSDLIDVRQSEIELENRFKEYLMYIGLPVNMPLQDENPLA